MKTKQIRMQKRAALKVIREVFSMHSIVETKEKYFNGLYDVLQIRNAENTWQIRIAFNSPQDYALANGTVNYLTGGCWYTFDRHGIEQSFYIDRDYTEAKLKDVLQKQLLRIAEAQERNKTMLAVPDTHFRITPQRKAALTAKLQNNESVLLAPSGMGIALRFKRTARPWDVRASAAQKRFFEVPTLYIEAVDWD